LFNELGSVTCSVALVGAYACLTMAGLAFVCLHWVVLHALVTVCLLSAFVQFLNQTSHGYCHLSGAVPLLQKGYAFAIR
jgi:hypothetical protein